MASKLWGDWRGLRGVMTGLTNTFRPGHLQDELNQLGEELLERVKANIRNGSLDLAPITSKHYANRKLDSRILINTGEWVDKLSVEKVVANTRSFTVFIGGASDVIHERVSENGNTQSVTMAELTSWIEYGTANSPPRPAIHMTWDQVRPATIDKLKEILGKEIFDMGISIRL